MTTVALALAVLCLRNVFGFASVSPFWAESKHAWLNGLRSDYPLSSCSVGGLDFGLVWTQISLAESYPALPSLGSAPCPCLTSSTEGTGPKARYQFSVVDHVAASA